MTQSIIDIIKQEDEKSEQSSICSENSSSVTSTTFQVPPAYFLDYQVYQARRNKYYYQQGRE